MLDNEVYPSVEAAYQAAKTTDLNSRIPFQDENLPPGKSKRLGKTLKIREDWNDIKIEIMRGLLEQKFAQYKFKNLLLETGDAELIEGNTWSDFFWGVCNGKGENWLGKLLMEIRGNIQNAIKNDQRTNS